MSQYHIKTKDHPTSVHDPIYEGPNGWIQWKGTNVCMDVYCTCGGHTHVDGDFVYAIKCGECGALYEVSGHIALIPVDKTDFRPVVSE